MHRLMRVEITDTMTIETEESVKEVIKRFTDRAHGGRVMVTAGQVAKVSSVPCPTCGVLPESLVLAVAKAIADAHDDGVGPAGGEPLANGNIHAPLWSSDGDSRSAMERAIEALGEK